MCDPNIPYACLSGASGKQPISIPPVSVNSWGYLLSFVYGTLSTYILVFWVGEEGESYIRGSMAEAVALVVGSIVLAYISLKLYDERFADI